MTSLTKILQTYTHITSAIKSCKTLAQLDSCDNMITSLNMHNDRSDLHEWIKAVDETYLKKREELQQPIKVPSITSMKVVSDVGAMCDEVKDTDSAFEMFTDNCTH